MMQSTDTVIGFGAIPSPIDYRDIGLAQISEPRVYPTSYFNAINNLPIWHQRKLGACVGHASAKYKQKLDYNDTGEVRPLSPRFVYSVAKMKDGISSEGTYPRLVADILMTMGCATEATCPNDTTLDHEIYVYLRDSNLITQDMLDDAKQAKIKGYAFADITLQGLKQAIVDFNGCALLVNVGSEWYTDELGNVTWDGNKLLPVRPPKQVISGHEVYLYGYEDIDGDTRFWFVNSWSTEWGQGGCGYFLWSQYKDFIREGITYTDIPDALLKEIKDLPSTFHHTFTTPMVYEDQNEEVKWLQRALKVGGFFNNSVTGYFGDITRRALFEFQKKYVKLSWYERNIMKGSRCGAKTLQALNNLYK